MNSNISIYGSLLEGRESERQNLENAIGFHIGFHEKTDRERLQRAVDEALKVCPFVAYIPVRENGFVNYKTDRISLKVCDKLPSRFGTAETEGHYAAVLCKEKAVEIFVSHGICDAEAVTWFIDAMLSAYFGSKVYRYKGLGNGIDLMAEKLSVPENFVFKDYTKSPAFSFPEAGDGGKRSYCLLKAKRKEFGEFYHRMHCSPTAAAVYFLFEAVQRCVPENDVFLTCRTPVSTRKVFRAEDSFQNASVPNIVFAYDGPNLLCEDAASVLAEFDRIKAEQTEPARLAFITNSYASFFMKQNADKIAEILKINSQSLFVSCIRNGIPACAGEHVSDYMMSANAMCPLALYVTYSDDRVFFGFTSTFNSERYLKMFKRCLEETGIGCETAEGFDNRDKTAED